MTKTTSLLAAGALAFAAAGAANAMPAVGLVGERTLVLFDTEARAVSRSVEVSGVPGLLGIDMRPADGKLYGVATDGRVVTIDPATGATAQVSRLASEVPAGEPVTVDFNPAADKLRVMAGTTNLRIDVDKGAVTADGALAFDPADKMAGAAPKVVAGAYSNARGKPEKTALYDIDAASASLLQQVKPNDGVLAGIGALGTPVTTIVGFDIATTADGTNTAFLVSGNRLMTVDLASGKAADLGAIEGVAGGVRDIAVMPR